MIKVKATDASFYYKKKLAEFNRIVYPGEVFEVTEPRFRVLSGDNKYGLTFVTKVEDELVEEAVEVNTSSEIIPDTEQEPEIFIINPGEDPQKVDENLNPVTTKKKRKSKKTSEA